MFNEKILESHFGEPFFVTLDGPPVSIIALGFRDFIFASEVL